MAVARPPDRTKNFRSAPPTDANTASAVLVKCYDDTAGAEALLRAFLAERDCDSSGVRFWIEVYRLIVESP